MFEIMIKIDNDKYFPIRLRSNTVRYTQLIDRCENAGLCDLINDGEVCEIHQSK